MSKKIAYPMQPICVRLVLLFSLFVPGNVWAQVPVINSVRPLIGLPGTTVVIKGSNFNDTAANNVVFFGATMGNVVSVAGDSIVVRLDTGATYERITVLNTTTGLIAETDARFTQTFTNSYFINNILNFKARVDYSTSVPTGAFTFSLALADFNDDGKTDIAVVNRGASNGNIVVFRNNTTPGIIASSSFSITTTLGGSLRFPTNVKAADIDGDGKKDLICTERGTSRVLVYANTSTGGVISFAATPSFFSVSPAVGPQLVSCADLDGDGKIDMSVTSGIDDANNDTLVVFRNTSTIGSISMGSAQIFPTGRMALGISIADFNNDNRPDVFTVDTISRKISIFRNTSSSGTISFAARDSINPLKPCVDAVTADIDSDGKQDIVYSCQYADSIGVFRNTSSGSTISFAASTYYRTDYQPLGISAGDLNGDGRPEIAVAAAGAANINCFRNTSSTGAITSGSMAALTSLRARPGPINLNIGDMDGDHYPDIVVANYSGASISIFRNYPLPQIGPIRGDTSVCFNSDTTQLTDSITGGTWSIANPSLATITSTGLVTGIAPGVDTVFYTTIAGGDTNMVMRVIVIDTFIYVDSITGPREVCIGPTYFFSNAVSGGKWSSSNPSVASINSTTGVLFGLSPGVAIITYTFINSCDSSSDTFAVAVRPNPAVSPISGPSRLCTGFSITLTDTASVGGTTSWATSDASIASVSSTGVVTGIAPGVVVITFTFANFCGTRTATKSDTVIASPSIGPITGRPVLCEADTTTLNNAVSGGSWSVSNVSLASINPTTGLVRGVGAGVVIVTYSFTNSCGTATDTFLVTINPLPVSGVLSGATEACGGGFSFTMSSTGTGGTWSSSNTSVATVSTTGTLTSVSPGLAIISYSVTNGCGTRSDTLLFDVQVAPTAGTLSAASATVCESDSVLFTSTVLGGVWAVGNTAIATIGSANGRLYGLRAGSTAITYIVTNSCDRDTAYSSITVAPAPRVGAISGTSLICVGNSTTLTDTPSGGVWLSSNTAVASINPSSGVATGTGAGSATITYTITNSCGSISDTFILNVATPASAGTITGVTNICMGGSTTLSNSATGGVWSSSAPAIASVSTTGDVTGVARGNAIISYTVTNTCGSVSDTFLITVDSMGDAGSITGPAMACEGSTYSLTASRGGGVWSSSAPATASVSSTGVVTAILPGTSIISYTVTNACGVFSDTLETTVRSIASSGTVTGTDTLCLGATARFASTVMSGVWSTSDASVASVSTLGDVTGISTGDATIFYTVSDMCSSGPSFMRVTILTVPTVPSITGPSSICLGTSVTETIAATGGVWSLTAVNTSITASSASSVTIRGDRLGTDTLTYIITNVCGSATSAPKVLNVITSPDAGTITGPSILCAGTTITLTNTTSSSAGNWTSTASTIVRVNGTTGVVTGLSGGTATITYTVNAGTCGTAAAYYTVFVNVQPNAGILTGSDTICAISSVLLSASGLGDYWLVADTNFATITSFTGSSALVLAKAEGIATIYYVDTNYCGSDTAMFDLFIHPAPPVVAPIMGANTACLKSTITLTDTTMGGIWSSGNPAVASVSATGIVYAVAPGTAAIVYAVTNSCTTTQATLAIRVSGYPSLTGSRNATVCDSVLFNTYTPTTDSAGITPNWSRAATMGLSNLAATGSGTPSEYLDNTTNAVVNTQYIFEVSKNGCTNYDTVIVAVKPTPYLLGIKDFITCSGSEFMYTDSISTGKATSALWTRASVTGITPATATGSHAIYDTLKSSLSVSTNVVYVYNLSLNGCTNTDYVTLKVFPVFAAPKITTHSPSYLCNQTMYQNFGAATAPPAGVSYFWSTTDGASIWATGNTDQYCLVNFEKATTAYVKLTTSIEGSTCLSSDSFLVFVNGKINEFPEVIYFENEFICLANDVDSFQWGYDDAATLDSTLINGQTTQNYTLFTPDFLNKHYWVITNKNGCMQKSYYRKPTGVTEIATAKGELLVSPNPTNGNFTIRINHTTVRVASLQITNAIGQVVHTTAVPTNTAEQINLNVAPGVYMITVTTGNERLNTRLVIAE